MRLRERSRIVRFHRRRIARYGEGTPASLGWKVPTSQSTRFEVICRVGDLTGSTILDLGCGYGDLRAYIDERFSGVTYIGVDAVPEFIEHAARRYQDRADTSFLRADFAHLDLPTADYVVSSGAFAYRRRDQAYYTDIIQKMYDAATVGVAFNMLDDATFVAHGLLAGHDKEHILAFCRSIAPAARLVSGYLADDFTVFMYRSDTVEACESESGTDGGKQAIRPT